MCLFYLVVIIKNHSAFCLWSYFLITEADMGLTNIMNILGYIFIHLAFIQVSHSFEVDLQNNNFFTKFKLLCF